MIPDIRHRALEVYYYYLDQSIDLMYTNLKEPFHQSTARATISLDSNPRLAMKKHQAQLKVGIACLPKEIEPETLISPLIHPKLGNQFAYFWSSNFFIVLKVSKAF